MTTETKRVYNISHTPVVSTGCKYHDDCFACPYSDCAWGTEFSVRSFRKKQRDIEIKQLRRDGMSIKEIAIKFNVTERTIQRALKEE
jgi:hypothetical protein